MKHFKNLNLNTDPSTPAKKKFLEDYFIYILLILFLVIGLYALFKYIYNYTARDKKKRISKNRSKSSRGSTIAMSAISMHSSFDGHRVKRVTPKTRTKSKIKSKRKHSPLERKNPISMVSHKIASELNSTDVNSSPLKNATSK